MGWQPQDSIQGTAIVVRANYDTERFTPVLYWPQHKFCIDHFHGGDGEGATFNKYKSTVNKKMFATVSITLEHFCIWYDV